MENETLLIKNSILINLTQSKIPSGSQTTQIHHFKSFFRQVTLIFITLKHNEIKSVQG